MAANDGRFDDAERFFKIVLNDNQDSASAWSNLGNVHLSLGRPKDATKEFTKAIALAPEVELFHTSWWTLYPRSVSTSNRCLSHDNLTSSKEGSLNATFLDSNEIDWLPSQGASPNKR